MIYALIVREPDGLVDRAKVRREIDDALVVDVPDPETWGTSPEAQARLRAAELQFGAA